MQKPEREARRAQWRKWVEEQRRSGLTQKNYCKQHDLSLHQFVYYNGLFKNKDGFSIKKPASFLPVKISAKENTVLPGDVKLSLPNGFQCVFPIHFEPSQVKRWVEALLSC